VKSPILLAAALLALLALALHSAVTLPARREAGALLGEQDKLRHDLGRQRLRLVALETDEASRRLALDRLGGVGTGASEAVTDVRRSLLASIDRLALDGAQMSVRPGRGATAATVSLSVTATLDELVALSEALARPGSGIALHRARLSPTAGGVLVEIEGASLRETKP
jgi:hypothetical protein